MPTMVSAVVSDAREIRYDCGCVFGYSPTAGEVVVYEKCPKHFPKAHDAGDIEEADDGEDLRSLLQEKVPALLSDYDVSVRHGGDHIEFDVAPPEAPVSHSLAVNVENDVESELSGYRVLRNAANAIIEALEEQAENSRNAEGESGE
jgi:hypothetical protein